jgi:hypothetical protein
MKRVGFTLLQLPWAILTFEVRSPGFVAHAPTWIKRLEATVRGNTA